MNKFVAAIGCAAFLASSSAQAVFIDFETDLGGLTPTTNPTQGGALDNASELNDEIVPLRITSGGLSSNPVDSFLGISGLLDLTGTPFGPARSGTNVVAGLEGGSGGPGSQAVIDFRNFVEVRVLDDGFTFVSQWIQLFGTGTTALVRVCGDLNCGDELFSTTMSASGLFSFTAPPGSEIRNISMIPTATIGGGAWIDDITLLADGGTVPEPHTALLLTAGLIAFGIRRRMRHLDA
jgi:PEP-CTERM motif